MPLGEEVELQIVRWPDRKAKTLCLYDRTNNVHVQLARFVSDAATALFMEIARRGVRPMEDKNHD